MDYLSEILVIGKYIIGILGILGVIIMIAGVYRKQKTLITSGGYLIILAIVLGACGYLIYQATLDRANNMLQEIQNQGY